MTDHNPDVAYDRQPEVVGGVDTHADTHHAAVLDAATGTVLGDAKFTADTTGYQALIAWLLGFGVLLRIGIEGTNSYGAGLTRYATTLGIDVREVIRPNRAERRLHGKSDPLDAITAARETLARTDLPTPKTSTGPVESIRSLRVVYHSAVKARAVVLTQLKSLLVTAPAELREHLAPMTDKTLIATILDEDNVPNPSENVIAATKLAVLHLARRHQHLTTEIDALNASLKSLVDAAAPALVAAKGIGTITAAQLLITAGDNPERIGSEAAFAALCGTNPIPASSGKTNRYRLNRGGDRQANCAVHRIALVRMSNDERTRTYIAKRLADGKTKKEAMRCLKRAIAREVFHLIVHPTPVPRVDDLRPARQQRGWSLQHVADHFGVYPARISEIERGKRRDDTLATAYRDLLAAA